MTRLPYLWGPPHSPACGFIYPADLTDGRPLPADVLAHIGVWVCADGCPRLAWALAGRKAPDQLDQLKES